MVWVDGRSIIGIMANIDYLFPPPGSDLPSLKYAPLDFLQQIADAPRAIPVDKTKPDLTSAEAALLRQSVIDQMANACVPRINKKGLPV